MASAPPRPPPPPSFKAGSTAATGRPPAASTRPQASEPSVTAAPRNPALRGALEERLLELPLARSRPLQDPAAGTMKAPVLKDRVIALPAPPPITEQEVLERFAALADPFFRERERAPGEAVALGDAVLVSWEAVLTGSTTPLTREERVEGRVVPDARLPGFFEGMVGRPVGASARFSSVMPEDFAGEPSARGKQVDFTVDIHRAVERHPPEAESPELLRALGYGTLQEAMDALGQQALAERTRTLEHQARMQVYDLLLQGLESVIPGDWVDAEVREQWKAHRAVAQARGEPLDTLESWLGDAGLRSEAELRLRLDLALQAVCARDKVRSGPEQEGLLVEALAQALGVEAQALEAQLAGEAEAGSLVRKAAWFIQASEHVVGQVKSHVEGVSPPPAATPR